MYDVYAYWNVSQLVAIFNGIAAIAGSDDFAGLVRAIAVLGLIIAAIASLLRMRGRTSAAGSSSWSSSTPGSSCRGSRST